MITGIRLDGHKDITKDKKLKIYNKPKYVYIPLINGKNTDVSILVKKGDYVYKGTILGKTKGNFKIPILSSVSGIVLGYTDSLYNNGESVKSIVIENDFKEKSIEIELFNDLHKLSKEDFIKRIYETGIIGMGGSGFPTYIKYENNSIKTLIINAVECEPYITADYCLFMNKTEEILDIIDIIMEINNIDECFIAVKKTNAKLIKKINNFIGSYLKIKVKAVPNLYPMGWEKNIVKYIKKTDYNNIPSEVGVIINNVSTIYAIGEALNGNCLTDRIITLTGDMLKQPTNVLVKIGTPISEVIESFEGYKRREDINFIAGGPMMGISLENDNLIVTPNLNCVLVIKNEDVEDSINCLRCGKCVSSCPSKLCPVLIKDNIKDKEKLKELNVNKCVECGLCSYVCPSKINVREFVRKAKEIVKKEG